jgi:hypothetical protein
MTPDEFKQLMADTSDADLLGPALHDAVVPYVFETEAVKWEAFRGEVTTALAIGVDDLAIVGSGRMGFSLKPDNNLRAFRDTSDVDVVIVNPDLFDALWYNLLRAAYPRPPMSNTVGGWLRRRQKEVYTGWLSPLKVRLDRQILGARVQPVLDFNVQWFTTFKEASRHVVRRHEDVQGRLYRTWTHVDLYHLASLAALRRSLAA